MRAVIVLALVGRAATAAAQAAEVQDIDGLEGTFDGKQHDETPAAGLVDDRVLTDGKLTLHRTAENLFEGEASAHLVIKARTAAGGVVSTTAGEGDVTGTVRLQFRGEGKYNIQWKLSSIAATTTLTAPKMPAQTIAQRLAFKGGGNGLTSFEGNGALATPITSIDIDATDEHTPKEHYRKLHWKLSGATLVAVPRVTPVERGNKSHLDGTASTPKDKITKYHWKLEPEGDCTESPKAKEIDGATIDVTLLCSMKATLVVWAGTKHSKEAAATAVIKPRDWHTRPRTNQGPFDIPGVGLVAENMLLGENVCALEGKTAPAAGHVFHRKGSGYRDEGYTIDVLHEPNSPFDGWAYVKSWSLVYSRMSRVNRELAAGSATGNVNELNHDQDLRLVRDCTVKHEAMHDKKMQEALFDAKKPLDPAKQVEAIISSSTEHDAAKRVEALSNSAIDTVDSAITATKFYEERVHAALTDDAACKRSATICMLTTNNTYQEQTFGSVAEMGDGGGAASDRNRSVGGACVVPPKKN
jgi:hypothetical protein